MGIPTDHHPDPRWHSHTIDDNGTSTGTGS
jgi:hypothetical protein